MDRGHRPRVTFDVAADAYARFMGRLAAPFADQFVDLRGRCAELLPHEPIQITGVARAATARRPKPQADSDIGP